MSTVSRLHRPLRLLAFFFISAALLLVTLPPVAVQALDDETGVTEIIDNTQAEFASGVFQRTVVAATPATPTNPDQTGAIELAPAGALNRENWHSAAARLPQPLSDAPIVALDRYLFVIGGATNNGRSPYVYRGIVNQASGKLEVQAVPYPNGNDTFAAFSIPPANPGPECDTNNINNIDTGRSRAGAVAVPATNGTNLGYIFVIGGSMYDPNNCQMYDFSTNLVQRATVDASGDIISSSWQAQDSWRFPTLDGDGNIITDVNFPELRGVQNVQVVHVRTSAGIDFIYAIGGLSIAPTQSLWEDVYPYVFYTKVDANGGLVHPTSPGSATVWARLADLPFNLHSGTAIAARTTRIEKGVPVQKDAIFLLGGCTDADCATLNTSVYRANIDPTTGELTWTNQVARTDSGGSQAISIQGRQGVTGISFNNRIYYVTGSTSTGTPGAAGATATIPVAIYNDQFLLEDLTGSSNYFVGFNETNDYVLPQSNRRLNASVALVPAVPPSSDSTQVNAAWMYVIGGSDESNRPTPTIFVGGVGGANETTGTIRASEGWYYSQPFKVLTQGETSRLLAMKWVTDLDRSTNPEADIRIQFRAVVTSGTCRESDFNPSTSTNNPSRWRDLDGDSNSELRSKDGENVVRLINAFPNEEIKATCMQYRAQFIQGFGDRSYTPKLLYFAVEKVVAARPDILIDTFNVQTTDGSFTNIELTLRNLRNNDRSATRSVVAAVGGGGFFVDLCIAKRTNLSTPALTAVPAPVPNADPGAIPDCATVSAQVPKEAMSPGAAYTIRLTDWVTANGGTPVDWNEIFGKPGTYDVGIVVDYNALTGEDAQGRSNNRGESDPTPNGIIRTVTITEPPNPTPPSYDIFVPVIQR